MTNKPQTPDLTITLKGQEMTVADERRTISVAVTRKKKTAIDAIRNVAEGKLG